MLIRLIALFLCLVTHAAAQTGTPKTKSGLDTEVNTLWLDNSSGAITPFNARQTLLDMVATQFVSSLSCGGIDDTSIVQAQINATGVAIIPPSTTCVVSNIIATRNTIFVGSGPTSVIKFKTGSTGYMLDPTPSFYFQIDHLDIDGGNTVDYNGVSSPGTQSGVHLWANVNNTLITNSTIHGWNNIAIGINGDANAIENGTVVANNNISNNFCAIDTGPSGVGNTVCNATAGTAGAAGGEYLKITANAMIQNRWALVVDSGNVNTFGNDIAHNGTCLYINGSPTPNPDHGNFVSNLCNHSSVNAVVMHSGIGNGYVIANSQFFGGDWILNSPDGITISNNTIAVTIGMTLSGVGYINFANNWFTEVSPVFTDTSLNTHWNNNYGQICQCFIKNSTALLVDPAGTTVASTASATGSELTTDGTFTSDPGPWTKGTGWTINTGTNTANSAGNAFSFLTQSISAAAFSYYQVTFNITNYVSGVVTVGVGGTIANWPFFANCSPCTAIAPTLSSFDGKLYFVSASFVGSISNVSVKKWTTVGTLSIAQTLTIPTTVALLVTCNAANEGARAYVTDQNTGVAYRGAVTGGGTTRQAVLCSNSAWIQD